MNKYGSRDIAMHIQLLAVLTAVGSVFFSTVLLTGGLVLLPMVFFAPFSGVKSGGPAEAILLGLGSAAMTFAIGNLILGLSTAYGLFKRRPWARVLGIIDNGISLLSFPVGTMFGAYGLWVLLPADAVDYLAGDEFEDLKTAH